MKRALLILISLALMLSVAACGGDGSVPGETGGGDPAQEVDVNATPDEIFQMVVTEMMNVLQGQSDSAGMDLSAAFGLPANVMSYPQAKLAMTIVIPDDEGDATLNYQQTSLQKGEDGLHELSVAADGESYQSGAYFSGDEMLLTLADASQPMIKYSLPSAGDGAALSALPPMERFHLCITEDDPAACVGARWTEQITAIIAVLAGSSATESAAQTLSVGEHTAEVKTYTVTLNGEAAAQLLEQFVQTWQGDARVAALLSLSDNASAADEEEGPVSTPAMTQLAALPFNDGAYCTDASLTLVASVCEKAPAGLQLAYTCAAGSMTLDIVSLAPEGEEYIKTSLLLPDGASFEVQDVSRQTGADACILDNIHSISGNQGRFVSALHTEQQDSGSECTSSFSYSLSLAAEGELAEALISTGSYQHTKTGAEIAAEFNGVLTMIDEEDAAENTGYNFSGTMVLNEQEGEVTLPQFIEGSGISAADRAELSGLLTEDDSTVFGEVASLSPLQQSLMVNMLLLSGKVYQD